MLKILIPVDGSSCALEGVKYVIQESKQHTEPMHVHLVNVQPRLPNDVTRYARHQDVHAYQAECAGKALAAAVALLGGASLPHSVHISKGDVIESIVACAETLHCDRIVMGTARKNALVRFIEGSMINRVIARSDIPVEVIARERGTLLERFAVPVGFGAGLMLLWAALSE
ncbi:universal stress protein [Noviherbaspirillum sp. 1P10PC]|uniref:universal stress protein n=1 Tax=Noviherbaspirillum sp. 1P10PC TaxID=3132292 RepID=UPI0039A03C42